MVSDANAPTMMHSFDDFGTIDYYKVFLFNNINLFKDILDVELPSGNIPGIKEKDRIPELNVDIISEIDEIVDDKVELSDVYKYVTNSKPTNWRWDFLVAANLYWLYSQRQTLADEMSGLTWGGDSGYWHESDAEKAIEIFPVNHLQAVFGLENPYERNNTVIAIRTNSINEFLEAYADKYDNDTKNDYVAVIVGLPPGVTT